MMMCHWSSRWPAPSNSGSEVTLFHPRFRKPPMARLVLDVERFLSLEHIQQSDK
jgi:hypothetical protein